ncbi:hypothetical protein PRIPAC_73714 [Pristionchus pacificus]|uniref:Uncharacterized protein n=1 Tax=Pristionchus pacificus TaxID=54126 RepID=A0A2A6BG74_PRIPA|nr:hypothetical protein PRIPAC_73714 [Pristionchus pacificus]|eukprot:PDM64856.1 hypothetical protein PRIPAC_53112 [Pristionchus pacificus]
MRDSVRRRRQTAKEIKVKIVERAACKRGFQKKGRLVVAVAVTLACLIFYFHLAEPPFDLENLTDDERAELKLAEPALIANLTANSPYQLGRFCDSGGDCFVVEQRYWQMRGGLRAQRLIMYELNDKMALTMANLKTPEIITAHHLVHERWAVDPTILSFSYNLMQIAAGFMLEGLSFDPPRNDSAASVQPVQQLQRVLQIGMGGGTATGYLRMLPIQLHLDIVELEPAVYAAAKRWFDFPDAAPNINVHIMDGVVFLKEAAESGLTYDSVILDASSNSPTAAVVCPHPVFMADDVMDAMSKVIRKFEAHFRSCSALKILANGQKLLVCSNRDGFTWAAHRTRMLDNLEQFDEVMATALAPYLDQLNPVKE